jgi:HPt (histidine-containing phosphotransfer) domain-containing protein
MIIDKLKMPETKNPDEKMCMTKKPSPEISLDESAFTHLLEVGGTELLLQLMDSFFTRSPLLVEETLKAMENKDLKGVQFACHTLKTQASYLGARNLRKQTEELEILARKEAFSELQERILPWKKTYDQSSLILKEKQNKIKINEKNSCY